MATDYLRFHEYFRKRKQVDQSVPIASRSGFQDKEKTQFNENKKESQCESLGIITDKPKYRQYTCLSSRLSSFEKWPSINKIPTIEQLSEAGFAYTGVSDSVRCFYCGIGLKDWPEDACAWEQHVLASPTCGHVIQCKGKGYVNRITGECDDDPGDSACGYDSEVDLVQLAIKRNDDAVEVARLYCSDEEIIKTAIKSLIKQDIQRKITAVELVKAVEELKERQENEEESGDSDSETDDEDDIEETNRQLKDPVTCKICYDAISCIIMLPCGHMVCCAQCAPALTKCAICRTQIKGTIRAQMVS